MPDPTPARIAARRRFSDLRYVAAALALVLFSLYTVSVVRESDRLQAELRVRVNVLSQLSQAQRAFQTNPPHSPELDRAFEQVGAALATIDSSVPGLEDLAAQARGGTERLRAVLNDPGRRTEARTDLFVAIDDLILGVRGANRDVSIQLAEQWVKIQWIALGACAMATAMLVLLVLVRRRGRLAVAMRERVENALRETEEARRAEARASAAKSDFLATVSHEIRTPMTAILGTAELLSATQLGPRQQDHLEVIRGGGQALLRLINDVLDLSRFDSGRVELAREPFEVEAMLDSVALLFGAAAEDRGITFGVLAGPRVPATVLGDEDRLRQILVNLVSNAIKFTDAGSVVVRASWADGRLDCRVEDTGPGLRPEDAARVFQAFEQVDSSRAREHGGTGLGLAIAQRLVDAMGGTIGVESTPGKGSTFWFRIPAEEDRGPPLVEEQPCVVVGPPARAALAAEQLEAWGLGVEVLHEVDSPEQLAGRAVIHLSGLVETDGPAAEYRPNALSGPIRPRGLRRTLAGAPAMSGSIRLTDPRLATVEPVRGRLLVVDDNETNRNVIGALLERLGYLVDTAAGGPEALELTREVGYDLVFMDCDMPRMDGLETTEALRSGGGPTADAPIVGLSGHAGDDARDRGIEAGMSDYLAKPVRLRTLEATLERWLPGRGA